MPGRAEDRRAVERSGRERRGKEMREKEKEGMWRGEKNGTRRTRKYKRDSELDNRNIRSLRSRTGHRQGGKAIVAVRKCTEERGWMTDRIGEGQLDFNCSPNSELIVLLLSYTFINQLQPSVRQLRTQALYHTGFVG